MSIRPHGSRLKATDTRKLRARHEIVTVDPELLTKEHRAWSKAVLTRAGYQCEEIDPTTGRRCGKCAPDHRVVADHIRERKDGGDWSLGNGRALCSQHHTLKTLAERGRRMTERPELDVAASWHPTWLKQATIPFIVVCGAPASGKSTWVRQSTGPTDLVIDLDIIQAELSGLPMHERQHARGRSNLWLNVSLRRRNDMLASITRRGCGWRRAWLIVGEPSSRWRQWWHDQMGASVHLIQADEETCIARAMADPSRAAEREAHIEAIRSWFARYEPWSGDRVVTWDGLGVRSEPRRV